MLLCASHTALSGNVAPLASGLLGASGRDGGAVYPNPAIESDFQAVPRNLGGLAGSRWIGECDAVDTIRHLRQWRHQK